MRFVQMLISAGTLILLSACATQQENVSCVQRDWYELGRRDGARGATMDRMEIFERECPSKDWETIYINGRNAGLVDYCAPENAFELGRMGIAYLYVCPSTIEPAFLSAYRKGQHARKLEMRAKELDARINSLNEKVGQKFLDEIERHKLTSELEELRQLRARNTEELNQISK
ncbi:MAG: DUF2799 domain-containing protein [Calothrix sp. SM1_5_4]|nr:DUF2799 domain-containing protein [Calothrix sp. SM1_5_4]